MAEEGRFSGVTPVGRAVGRSDLCHCAGGGAGIEVIDTVGVSAAVASRRGGVGSLVGGGRYLRPVGILTDYFAATPNEALACALSGPFSTDLPKAELKWVEPTIILGSLWAAVDGADYSVDAYSGDDEMVASPDEQGPWVIRIKEACRAALAGIHDDQILPRAGYRSVPAPTGRIEEVTLGQQNTLGHSTRPRGGAPDLAQQPRNLPAVAGDRHPH